MRHTTDRRTLLRGALGAGVAGAALAGSEPVHAAPSAGAEPVHAVPSAGAEPFHGPRQAGIASPAPPHSIVLAADVLGTGRAALADLLAVLTDRASALTAGGPARNTGITGPPADSGLLGPDGPAGGLTVTVGVGASLFDRRFGLAARRPAGLTEMPTFPDDHLDPARCHGDLSLQICADSRDVVVHALRDIARATRGALAVRWRVDGFVNPPRPAGKPRNLLGFRDGTSNPEVPDLDRLVWRPDGSTFQVIRVIRMLVEFWDRIGLTEQENLIGRRRDSGAPMDGDVETDVPNFAADPIGEATPLTSHIRRANPRTPDTDAQRILRRGYNYDRGMDPVGNLDCGLVFVSYQADIRKQFEAVQRRLAGEPLVDYIQPVGGGYFLVLPGVKGAGDRFGADLIAG